VPCTHRHVNARHTFIPGLAIGSPRTSWQPASGYNITGLDALRTRYIPAHWSFFQCPKASKYVGICRCTLHPSKRQIMVTIEPVPFSEPPWLNALPSPYYNDSHRKWQCHCRAFIDEHFTKHPLEWERESSVPSEIYGELPD
jgi:hypothetical protein